jgi:hypothetical protein
MQWLQLATARASISAPSWMPSWVHWPQAPATFAIAALISWVSLLYGFHHKGRPFGSREATRKTVTIIAATSAIAAVASVFVPHLPLSVGIFVPALLCRSALKESGEDQELRAAHPQLAAIVTLGISYLINLLREQMADDRATWCEDVLDQLRRYDSTGVEDGLASVRNFATVAGRVQVKLLNRLPGDLEEQVRNHYSEINPATIAAENALHLRDDDRFDEEYNRVEEALNQLLQLAYDWKYTKINFPVMSLPPKGPVPA